MNGSCLVTEAKTRYRLSRPATPLEHQEQAALFQYAAIAARQDSRWGLLFAVPNGMTGQSMAMAVKAKKAGMKRGVPDVCLPVPSGEYHGAFIELKRVDGTACHVSPEQSAWIERLNGQGYYATVAYGWREAVVLIEAYLNKKPAQGGGLMRRVDPADH